MVMEMKNGLESKLAEFVEGDRDWPEKFEEKDEDDGAANAAVVLTKKFWKEIENLNYL